MSDVNFTENWSDPKTQCSSCKLFQEHNGKTACVPDGDTFEKALAQFGECPATAHCDYFTAK